MQTIKMFTDSIISVAEYQEGEDLNLRLCLCDFGTNANGVQINRATVENWLATAIESPIQAKVLRDKYTGREDFGSHEVKIIVDSDGSKSIGFDTQTYGVITGAEINSGDNGDYIVADVKIWSRYKNVISLIMRRIDAGEIVHGSWELEVAESRNVGGVKVLDSCKFLGFALLGAKVPPAFDCARIMEVASADDVDTEFCEAMMTDIAAQNEMKVGEQEMKKKDVITSVEDVEVIVPEIAEENKEEEITPVVSEEDKEDDTPDKDDDVEDKEDDIDESNCGDDKDKEKSEAETAALTEWDLREKLSRACAIKLNMDWAWVSWIFPADNTCWVHPYNANELDFAEFTYVVNGNDVEVSDPVMITLVASPREMSAKLLNMSTALTAANEKLQTLETEVSGLAEYKAAYEQAQAEKAVAEHKEKEAELSAYAIKSGRITSEEIASDETIKTLVAELNWDGVKMLIADRFMASLQDSPVAPVDNEDKTVVRASIEDETPLKAKDCVNAWLNSKKKK